MSSSTTNVSIYREQFEEIKELIFQKGYLGYRSVSEFVRGAIRRELDRCKMSISSREKEREKDPY